VSKSRKVHSPRKDGMCSEQGGWRAAPELKSTSAWLGWVFSI
jgi:hypothetical protein